MSNLNHIWDKVIGRLLLEISPANWRELSQNPWKVVVSTLWMKICTSHGFILPKFWDENSKQYLETTTTYTLSIPTGGNISRAAFASLLTAPSLRQVEEVPLLWQTIPKVSVCQDQFKEDYKYYNMYNYNKQDPRFSISSHLRRSFETIPLKTGNGFSGWYQPPKGLKPEKGDSLPELFFNFVSLFQSV